MTKPKRVIPPLPPGIYKHFKGREYELLHVATHSETQEEMVVYCDCSDKHKVWVRPAAMFREVIFDGGHWVHRFEFVRFLEQHGKLCGSVAVD